MPARGLAGSDAKALYRCQLAIRRPQDVGPRPEIKLGQGREAAGGGEIVGCLVAEVLVADPAVHLRRRERVNFGCRFD